MRSGNASPRLKEWVSAADRTSARGAYDQDEALVRSAFESYVGVGHTLEISYSGGKWSVFCPSCDAFWDMGGTPANPGAFSLDGPPRVHNASCQAVGYGEGNY